MNNCYVLKTKRTYLRKWTDDDLPLASLLWGNCDVSKYICASGKFSSEEIQKRLALEIENDIKYGIQYWPVFDIQSDALIGCCGLRKHNDDDLELGVHLLPQYWDLGYGKETCSAVIDYAFNVLKVKKLFAGHNPNNIRSRYLLEKLGFRYVKDEFYKPTGLYHPSYELTHE